MTTTPDPTDPAPPEAALHARREEVRRAKARLRAATRSEQREPSLLDRAENLARDAASLARRRPLATLSVVGGVAALIGPARLARAGGKAVAIGAPIAAAAARRAVEQRVQRTRPVGRTLPPRQSGVEPRDAL